MAKLNETEACCLVALPGIGVSSGNRAALLYRQHFDDARSAREAAKHLPSGYSSPMLEQAWSLFAVCERKMELNIEIETCDKAFLEESAPDQAAAIEHGMHCADRRSVDIGIKPSQSFPDPEIENCSCAK
jgi:hypothetical protein